MKKSKAVKSKKSLILEEINEINECLKEILDSINNIEDEEFFSRFPIHIKLMTAESFLHTILNDYIGK